MNKKISALIFVIILVLNLTFFALGKLNEKVFWIVLAFCAYFAYVLFPKKR